MIKPGRIIVIGGNAAGPAAAAKAKRINPDAEVIMYEAGDYISTGTCEIPYALAEEIPDYKSLIFYDPISFETEKGVKVFINHRVEFINSKDNTLTVKNIKTQQDFTTHYDALIITSGSYPKSISYFKHDYKNLRSLKSIKDLEFIKNYFQFNRIKKVAVFGAGYIGLETAEALSKLNLEVVLIEKEELPISNAEKEISVLIKELISKNNIEFYGSVNSIKYFAENNRIKSINIDSRIIDVDFVINAAGFKPNNQLALQAGLKLGKFGGIAVDRKLKTSDQFIYAAGDCIEVTNFITNKSEYIPLASAAHLYGHIAGENAAGGNVLAEPIVRNISVKIFNKYYVCVGLTEREAKESGFYVGTVQEIVPNLVKVMPESNNVFGKIVFERSSSKILGASFLGDKEVSGYSDIISTLIKTRQSAEILSEINFNYTPPLSPFINLLSVLGRKIKKQNK